VGVQSVHYMCRVSNKAGRSTNPTRQETSHAVLVAPERERLIGSADHRESESEGGLGGGLVGTSPRAASRDEPFCGVPTSPAPNGALSTSPRVDAARNEPICGLSASPAPNEALSTSPRVDAARNEPICGLPTSPAPNEALSTSPLGNAAREDPICGRDGRLPAGVSPLSSEQLIQWRENRELNLTRVQRAQLSVAMLNSAPLTPPTVEEASRWTGALGSAATLGSTATSTILTWRDACVVASRHRFRPVFLDQVQWNQTDPRLASLARAASEFNASMIKKYGVPFRRDTANSCTDTDGNTAAC